MKLTKERIVHAAIDILNRDGKDGLTMRTLADGLGVKAASLYWHIKDKDELYGMITEYVFSQIKMSAGLGEPKKYLYEFYTKFRSRLLELRDPFEIFVNAPKATPKRSEAMKNALECLSKTGVRDENCLTAANMLNNYVLSFVADEIRYRNMPPEENDAADEKLARWNSKSVFYCETQFLYGMEVLFSGFKNVSPQKVIYPPR